MNEKYRGKVWHIIRLCFFRTFETGTAISSVQHEEKVGRLFLYIHTTKIISFSGFISVKISLGRAFPHHWHPLMKNHFRIQNKQPEITDETSQEMLRKLRHQSSEITLYALIIY